MPCVSFTHNPLTPPYTPLHPLTLPYQVRDTEPLKAAAATGGAAMPNPVMHHITGPCEVTLPTLY